MSAFPDVVCINSHDQRTMEGTDKDQRLKVLLHVIHNENIWMLILTQAKSLEPLKSSQPPKDSFFKGY